MSFCEHCAGQRFDRAQVLRALRAERWNLRRRGRSSQADAVQADAALAAAIRTIRALEIPHIEDFDDTTGEEVLH